MDERVMSIREQGWLQTIQAAAGSGQSTKEWCEQNGVAQSTFYRWKQRLRGQALARLWPETAEITQAEGQAAAPVPVFAQLSCRDASGSGRRADIQTHASHRTTPLRIRSGTLTLAAALKENRKAIKRCRQENGELTQRIETAASAMQRNNAEPTEWDKTMIRQLVETVRVISAEKIEVTLRGGNQIVRGICW